MRDYYKQGEDCNHWIRRFFRCYIDGSYKGANHYARNCEFIQEHINDEKTLRSFVIREFCDFMALEHSCSSGHVQKSIVDECSKDELNRLNRELIDDAKDLVADLIV